MEPKREKKSHLGIITLITICAVAIVWYAFNREGEDVVPAAVNNSQEAAQAADTAASQAAAELNVDAQDAATEVQLAAAEVEARAELALIEARVESGEVYEDVAGDIAAIEADLAEAYAAASVEAQADWEQTQEVFVDLEASLRDGTSDALEYFAEIALLLEADVRVDEDVESETTAELE
jgi:hypothetical protein